MTQPTEPRVASCAEAGDAVHTAVPSDEAPAASATSPPNDAWRVLQSGALAHRLPPTDDGKEAWLDAQPDADGARHSSSPPLSTSATHDAGATRERGRGAGEGGGVGSDRGGPVIVSVMRTVIGRAHLSS